MGGVLLTFCVTNNHSALDYHPQIYQEGSREEIWSWWQCLAAAPQSSRRSLLDQGAKTGWLILEPTAPPSHTHHISNNQHNAWELGNTRWHILIISNPKFDRRSQTDESPALFCSEPFPPFYSEGFTSKASNFDKFIWSHLFPNKPSWKCQLSTTL